MAKGSPRSCIGTSWSTGDEYDALPAMSSQRPLECIKESTYQKAQNFEFLCTKWCFYYVGIVQKRKPGNKKTCLGPECRQAAIQVQALPIFECTRILAPVSPLHVHRLYVGLGTNGGMERKHLLLSDDGDSGYIGKRRSRRSYPPLPSLPLHFPPAPLLPLEFPSQGSSERPHRRPLHSCKVRDESKKGGAR